ncbi:MAG: ABC transporter ATP-binding protein [Bacilli bacterium]
MIVTVFGRLRSYYQPYLRYLWFSLATLGLATALGLIYPYVLKLIIDRVVIGHAYGNLFPYLAVIAAAALAKGVCNFAQQYLGQVFGINTAYRLRNDLYRKLNTQSFSYYDNVHTGDLMSRLTADLDAFRQFLAFGLNNFVSFLLLTVFGLGLMFSMNVKLTLAVICLMPVLAYVAVRFDSKLWPAYISVRQKLGRLNTSVQENIMGVRTVKSFAREDHEVRRFGERNEEYFSSNIRTANLWKNYFPYMELIGNLEVAVVLLVGGYFVAARQMPLGDLVAFFSILWYIIQPMSQLGYLLNTWTQSQAAGLRLLEILEAPQAVDNPPEVYEGDLQGHVVFRNVNLVHEGNPVLNNINFEVLPGRTVALLGLTGAGKSSLVNLIPRFYDVTSGQVLVDGVDVREWDLQALRRQVAVVFQESFLFSTTIFANIAYGHPDASMEDVQRAAELAHAAEFIDQLPQGYETLVGERGLGLSGGQKQRIALARAILADPRILILDDATSAVDMETEFEIGQALQDVMRGRATFVIAHRISSLKRADQILVVDEGRIVQRGTHDQLLREDGLYRVIFDMQFRDHDSFADGMAASAAELNPAGI